MVLASSCSFCTSWTQSSVAQRTSKPLRLLRLLHVVGQHLLHLSREVHFLLEPGHFLQQEHLLAAVAISSRGGRASAGPIARPRRVGTLLAGCGSSALGPLPGARVCSRNATYPGGAARGARGTPTARAHSPGGRYSIRAHPCDTSLPTRLQRAQCQVAQSCLEQPFRGRCAQGIQPLGFHVETTPSRRSSCRSFQAGEGCSCPVSTVLMNDTK